MHPYHELILAKVYVEERLRQAELDRIDGMVRRDSSASRQRRAHQGERPPLLARAAEALQAILGRRPVL